MDVSETRSPLAHCASAAKEEAVSESTDITETEASVLQQETASEVKQEALLDRMVQSPTSPPLLDRNECSSSPIKMQGSMVVKEESSSLVEMEDEKQEETGKEMELLGELKQEAVEDEEEEEMPLPDSTPTVDDMEHGYEQRLSPSPMASLQLTRADTTTTTSVAAAHVSSLLTEDEDMEMKLLGMQDCNPDGVHVEYDESEFVWEEYLQETGASAVPPTAFKHVECSLESGFVKGMRVEVANKSAPGTYWVASIIMTCGPLLRLRYEGYEEDGSADFWSDLSACEIHPIGWCTENGQVLQPPEALKEKHEDWPAVLRESLKSARTVPSYLLDITTGTTPVDQLKQGMRLELQDSHKPSQVWLARIIENVGGRLYLRVEGMDSGIADFWAFYLNENLHPIGWGKQMGYFYHPPQVLLKQGLSEEEIKHILESALREANDQQLPADIFKDQEEIVQHTFQCGMKLEAVNPNSRNQICPATVVEVIDSRYFVVEIDDLQETDAAKRIHFCGHSRTPTIFPIQWTIYKGIKLTPPPGWCRTDFSWTEYLAHCRAMAAPETCFDLRTEEHEFERGMKLEAVNPHNPNQICAATITKIVDHLMWVHLDSSTRIVASHVEHISSHNLFPVGWCESNGYQLRPPRKTGIRPGMGSPCKRVAVVQPEMADGLPGKEEENEGRTYCPKIYFNHRCFSGPYLSKGRIAELPQSVGPGPLQLVMKEVLTMLISVAYKSCRVLREIQLDGPPNPAMHQQILRAKYKSKSYCAVVEICRTTAQLEDFCRQVCIKLECCPNLISPHFVGSNCPENCSQLTKTKYTYYYGKKKRKIGRPPGGHTNLENGPKKATKRRKRRRIGQLVPRKSHSIHDEEEEEDEGMEEDKASIASDTHTVDSSSTGASRDDFNPDTTVATGKTAMSKRLKRKYTHHIPPPSEIRTRGAKLPRYSFERRTHKKILLSQPSQSISGLRSKSLQFHQPSMTSSPPASETSISRPRAATPLLLDKNPLQWTVSDTVEFIQTTDCSHVAKVFREQEIDGQALLLLTLPTVQEHLELKLGPAIKLCHQIERVKRAFYEQYATSQPRSHR
ncbi:hypothetical protein C0Q70_14815 [Pomacea canaliculata]|uniref:SAM domain-containing protein n=3 Tax=Pomacea canaliculata TaxID=400727 RepID=A0A2T7NT34_POMCA|nr:hypothetical protein C0Q70_14815 [Pomacea canaliculata]